MIAIIDYFFVIKLIYLLINYYLKNYEFLVKNKKFWHEIATRNIITK